MEQNQCDGCLRGLEINNYGNHIDVYPGGMFGCTKHLYTKDANGQHIELSIGCIEEKQGGCNSGAEGWVIDGT